MKQYTQTLHLDAPPEAAFAAVVDPANHEGRFMKVDVVKETPEGVGTTLHYHYEVLGLRLPGRDYTYAEYVPGERFRWEFSRGPAMLLMGGPLGSTFTFEAADGGTDVTIRPEFKTYIPGLNHLARRLMMLSWSRDLERWKVDIEKSAKGVKAKA